MHTHLEGHSNPNEVAALTWRVRREAEEGFPGTAEASEAAGGTWKGRFGGLRLSWGFQVNRLELLEVQGPSFFVFVGLRFDSLGLGVNGLGDGEGGGSKFGI